MVRSLSFDGALMPKPLILEIFTDHI